jgi:predicted Zn-dependent protease
VLRRFLAGVGGFFRRPWRVAAVLAALAGLALAAPHAWAWYHFAAGNAALDRYHGDEARGHLEECLHVWPQSVECHVLAARAARRAGDFPGAQDHLRDAQRLQKGPSEEVALETALLHAAGGDFDQYEDYLNEFSRKHPDRAPLVWEALAKGYLCVYRVNDALSVLKLWLDARPDDIQALAERGDVYWQLKSVGKAADSYRRVVELDPERVEERWRLAVGLMDGGHYEEALRHLEAVQKRRPDSLEVQVHLARCYARRDRKRQAKDMLDAVLTRDPANGPALRARGQIAFDDGQMADAEKWLRDAVRVMPDDQLANLALAQTLDHREGKEAEAKEQLARAEGIKNRMERLGEITTRELSAKPNDPALQAEFGQLLMDMGYKDIGKGWLERAVRLGPRAAHTALADYFQKQGDLTKAAEERRAAEASPSELKAP